MKGIRPIVFFIPIIILSIAVIMSFVNPTAYHMLMEDITAWVMANLGWLFSIISVSAVIACVWAFSSKLGRVRIGGVDATPILSKKNWFYITIATTIAVGLLFWASIEPMTHIYEPPPSLGFEPNSPESKVFTMAALFMHWSFTPYAIYAIPALLFALVFYNRGAHHTVGGMLSPLLGRHSYGIGGQIIDALALLAAVAGMASGLGQGLLTLAGGLREMFGISTSPTLLALIALTIMIVVLWSAVSGLLKGIRILSDINMKILMLLGAFVFIVGPTVYILSATVDGLGLYIGSFIDRSFETGIIANDSWSQSWTNFYWAQWLSWAPITGLFLGRIARGYTVREFITTAMVLPSAFSILWMGVFAGSTIYFDEKSGGAFRTSLEQHGEESVVYMLFDALPFTIILVPVFLIIAFISFVTATDSNTDAIAFLMRGKSADEMSVTGGGDFLIKTFFVFVTGVVAWTMTSFAGIEGIKMIANLGGVPALFIMIGVLISLWKFYKSIVPGVDYEEHF